jgi:hypothetical protein
VTTDDATQVVDDDFDPDEPDVLPVVELARGDDPRPARRWGGRWIVLAAAAVVVVGMVVGIAVFNASAPPAGRGATSAQGAARDFARAVDGGDGARAVAVSCTAFADAARALARSGRDKGIDFRLASVRVDSETSASAILAERLRVPGHTEQQSVELSLVRTSGHWQVCGRR